MAFTSGRRADAIAIGAEARRLYDEGSFGARGERADARLAIMALAEVAHQLSRIANSCEAGEPIGRQSGI